MNERERDTSVRPATRTERAPTRPRKPAASFVAGFSSLLALFLIACACTKGAAGEGGSPSSAARAPVIVGTVLDAATGEPLASVRVEGPEKKHAETDRAGRFEMKGLAPGTEGDLSVTLDDGRAGHVHVRHLAPGPALEVVIQVSRP